MRCRILLLLVFTSALFAQEKPKPSYAPIVSANNRFAIKLLKASFSPANPTNLVTGPAALSSGLSWVMSGASEPARTEIARALSLGGLYGDEINLQNLALIKAHLPLRGRHGKPVHYKPGESEGDKYLDRLESSPIMPRGYFRILGLWTEQPTSFKSKMKVNGAAFYGAELLDFPPHWTAADLDRWIDSRTMDAPGQLSLPVRNYNVKKAKGPLEQDFKLIDASLFNCNWKGVFSEQDTRPAQFHTSHTNTKFVSMMSRDRYMDYGESEQYQFVRLRYYEQYSLYVLLPNKNMNLAQFVAAFDENQIATFEKSLATRRGVLKMPKFDLASSQDATPALKKLGIKNAFESWESLKPGFPGDGGKLFGIQVRSHIKLDEHGTTLILVSETMGGVIGGIDGRVIGEVPFEMIVDRPFLFYIQDDVTDEVLFLGAVVEP